MRLWSIGFHRMIVTLRCASATSPNALEILTDFIYYAYKFYTELLEEHNLHTFRGKWLEALGDPASYCMAVAIHEQSRAAAAAAAAVGGDPLTASKLASRLRAHRRPRQICRVLMNHPRHLLACVLRLRWARTMNARRGA
jgi:hypothetical protein